MPGVNEPKKEPEKKRFITEKIIKQPLTKKQVARRYVMFLLGAVLFGATAGVSFAVSQPWATRHFGEESPAETMISIPKDEVTDTIAEPETESEAALTKESREESTSDHLAESQALSESESVEKMVRNAMENYQYTVDDLNALFFSLRQQAEGIQGNRGGSFCSAGGRLV